MTEFSFGSSDLTVKGYNGNSNIKRKGEQVQFTQEMISEFIKCSQDPIYFAENYIKIVHVDEGLINLSLYDYQKDIIDAITNNRRVTVCSSRQSGKCVHADTPIRLRNKKTGKIIETTIGEFYEKQKIDSENA